MRSRRWIASALALATPLIGGTGEVRPGAAAATPSSLRATALRALDGDTIEVRLRNGRRERVQLIGVDAPERRRGDCWSAEARAETARIVRRRPPVVLVLDARLPRRDASGRLLAYVEFERKATPPIPRLPNLDLGRHLLEEGFAVASKRAGSRGRRYAELQRVARSTRQGLWLECGLAPTAPENAITFTRPDGSAITFPGGVRAWCGPWPDAPRGPQGIHVQVGARSLARPRSFWIMSAVLRDAARQATVRFPYDIPPRPAGAVLFAVDAPRRANELASSADGSSGSMRFEAASCSGRRAIAFTVDAVLGSEFGGAEPVSVRGRFAAQLSAERRIRS